MDFLDLKTFDQMTTDPNDLSFALSPLADPVIGAIFASMDVSALAARDPGFQQFSDRHTAVSADPKTRREYVSWFGEMLCQQGQREWIEQEYAEKLAEAEQKHVADLAEAEQR